MTGLDWNPDELRVHPNDMGRILLTVGLLLVLAGLVVTGLERMGLGLGRLPGDLVWRGKSGTIFAPLGSSILVSLVLSLLLYIIARLRH